MLTNKIIINSNSPISYCIAFHMNVYNSNRIINLFLMKFCRNLFNFDLFDLRDSGKKLNFCLERSNGTKMQKYVSSCFISPPRYFCIEKQAHTNHFNLYILLLLQFTILKMISNNYY